MSNAYVAFGLTTNSGISNGFRLYPDRGHSYGSTHSQSYVNRLLVWGDPLYSGSDVSVTTKCNGVVQYQGVIPASLFKTPGLHVISDSIGVIYNPTGGSYRDWETDRKSTRLNSSHSAKSRMPSSA